MKEWKTRTDTWMTGDDGSTNGHNARKCGGRELGPCYWEGRGRRWIVETSLVVLREE